jgi:hypothetical protein
MARTFPKFAALAAGAAALSLAATPAEARGWGHYHHHDGVSFGDVVAGGLILGGIVAIASAANSSKHKEAYDYPPPPPPPSRYDDGYNYAPPPAPRDRDGYDYAPPRDSGYQSGGINGAVNACVDRVERGNDRVASVDNAARTADGWHVSGQLSQGSGFDCSIGNDGQVRDVSFGNGQSAFNEAPSQGGQWSDDAYASAREQADAGNPYDEPDSAE